MPGERVQDPFLILDVETRGGDIPHTMLILENSGGGVETASVQLDFGLNSSLSRRESRSAKKREWG
jgi:hypothetical protein